MKKIKSCLTCAFCIRNQNTFYSYPVSPTCSKWQYNQRTLSFDERDALKLGDDSFIGKEIAARESWDEQLKLKEEELNNQLENYPGLSLLYRLSTGGHLEDKSTAGKRFGLTSRPSAPTEDYLSCFHNQWNECSDISIQENRHFFLKEKKCPFYFPFKKMVSQSLTACEKNRKELQKQKSFYLTNFLALLSIVITVLLSL